MVNTRGIIPARALALAVADDICVAAAFVVSVTLRIGPHHAWNYVQGHVHVLAALCVVFPAAFYLCGLYASSRRRTAAALAQAFFSVCVGVAAVGAILFATWTQPIGRGMVLEFILMLAPAVVLVRLPHAQALADGMLDRRCIAIGGPDQAARVLGFLQQHPDSEWRVQGVVYPHRANARPGERVLGHPVLGTTDRLEDIVAAHRVDSILLGPGMTRDVALLRHLRSLRYRGVAVLDFVLLHERLAREIPVHDVDDVWLLFAAMSSSRLYIRVKRLLDVIGSAVLLVPAALAILPAALAIRVTSPGPVIFRQERLGLGGRVFTLLKLRTMRVDAEKLSGPMWSTDHDPRITRVGRFLRKFRLDELPQLVNVLRGDMSLVGPRPERPSLSRQISETVPLFSERLLVRPGITGWAQVMAPYAASVGDSQRKLQFDLYYAKHLSFTLDLVVLFKTVRTVIFGRERTQGGMAAGRQLEAAGSPEPVPAPPDQETTETSALIPLSRAG